jgi:hypothetical protein
VPCSTYLILNPESSISISGGTIKASLNNSIFPTDWAPFVGQLSEISGEVEANSTAEFVITASEDEEHGSTGYLMGTATIWSTFLGGSPGAQFTDTFTSNFVPTPTPGSLVPYTVPVGLSFHWGNPFKLTLGDDMLFSASGIDDPPAISAITSVDLTLSVYDFLGDPIPDATILPAPEISSLTLLITVSGIILNCMTRKRLIRRRSS